MNCLLMLGGWNGHKARAARWMRTANALTIRTPVRTGAGVRACFLPNWGRGVPPESYSPNANAWQLMSGNVGWQNLPSRRFFRRTSSDGLLKPPRSSRS